MRNPSPYVPLGQSCDTYKAHVEALQRTIRAGGLRRLSALIGPWGSGKSGFLHQVKEAFHDPSELEPRIPRSESTVCMQFVDLWDVRRDVNVVLYALSHLVRSDEQTFDRDDPWYFPVVKDILDQIDDSAGVKDKKVGLLKLRRVLMGLRAFGVPRLGRIADSAIMSMTLGAAETDFAGPLREFSDFYQDWQRAENLDIEVARDRSTPNWYETLARVAVTVDEARLEARATRELLERIRDLAFQDLKGKASDKRVVLVIDNLDRCPPETLLHFIEGLRLSDREYQDPTKDPLNGISFLLPLDESALRLSIKCRYPKFSDLDCDAYVAKVFFPIIPVPPLSQDAFRAIPGTHSMFSDSSLDKSGLSRWKGLGLEEAAKSIYGEVYLRNPRLAVRAATHTLGRLTRADYDKAKRVDAHVLSIAECVVLAGVFLEATPEFRRTYLHRRGVVELVADHHTAETLGPNWFGQLSEQKSLIQKSELERFLGVLHENPPVLEAFLWLDRTKYGKNVSMPDQMERKPSVQAIHSGIAKMMAVLA